MNMLFIVVAGALGTIAGSFIGVVAERAYTGQSWKRGRSRCNSCREDLSVRDLIPVFSWLMHRGRCRKCSSSVPGAYILVELSLGILFAAAYSTFGLTSQLLVFLAALCVLAFIVMYDLRHTLVPPGAAAALVVLSGVFALLVSSDAAAFIRTLTYATVIAAFFFSLYLFSRGRAMGLGDTPISFALALLAGSAAPAGFLFSFWIGGVIGICILVLRRGGPRMGIEVPFVPFMAAGFLLALFTQWNPLPPLF